MAAAAVVPAWQRTAPPPSIRDLLQAYWDGDPARVRLAFTRGADVEAMLPAIRIWIGTGARQWSMATSVLLLDLADLAVSLAEPSPRTTVQLLAWGREQIVSKRAADDPSATAALAGLWHEAAVALHLRLDAGGDPEEYLRWAERRAAGGLTPRLWLARGQAVEQRLARAGIRRLATDTVEVGDPSSKDGSAAPPTPDSGTLRALEDAARYYDRAARDQVLRAETSARAAAIFVEIGRHRDALRRIEVAGPAEDAAVAAWLSALEGRAWSGLGEHAAALAAFDDGLVRAPRARSLVAGRAAAAVALGRADAGAAASGPDPWETIARGGARWLPEWLARLRGAVSGASARAAARPPAIDILDQYDAGQHDAAAAALVTQAPLAAFAKALRAGADVWTRERGPAHFARRDLVVALVALEAAHARGGTEWGDAHQLLEWACARLRASPPPAGEVERAWMHAAAALMQGVVAGVALEVHVGHALERAPRDPALLMAAAVAAELRAGPDQRLARGTRPPPGAADSPDNVPTVLDQAVRRFEDTLALDAYAEEARLRLAYTALRRGRASEALAHLDRMAADDPGDDVFITYLAALFRGRALERLDRRDDAVVAYEQAVAIQPGAQTAELALAAALAHAGRRAEAAALADRALTRTAAGFDPWLVYGQGDFRHWPRLIAALRSAVQ
jgi:tetratricopeptide (TPR) repeat protein